MNKNKISLLTIFKNFFRVGLYTIGGAYAMLPVASRILVDQAKILSDEELHDKYSVAQTMPGVISANMANLIGFSKRGYLGALMALFGVITPSIIIIILIAHFLTGVQDSVIVQKFFWGIRVLVVALLTQSIYKFVKSSIKSVTTILITVLFFVLIFFSVVKPIFLMIIAAFCGYLFYKPFSITVPITESEEELE